MELDIITPFATELRELHRISSLKEHEKLHATLLGVALAALKVRVHRGEPDAVREVWDMRDKTFLSIDLEWNERDPSQVLEWGYAAVRCGSLKPRGEWPPNPESAYRRRHYIVADFANKVENKHCPNFPGAYAFGDSAVVSSTQLPRIIQSIISLASPDSEDVANTLVLVAHGASGDLSRLREMDIQLPSNVLIIDTSSFERQLYKQGLRDPMQDRSGSPRKTSSTISLGRLLDSLGVDVNCKLHNAGNDAFLALLAFQLLLDPDNTKVPQLGIPEETVRPFRSSSALFPIAPVPSASADQSDTSAAARIDSRLQRKEEHMTGSTRRENIELVQLSKHMSELMYKHNFINNLRPASP
ncbi:hypothetical protein WOLCODRAFT_148353 [Wolfiporia cocos MD-104 SS10]|uniref:Gfd2/YDR514C-like C-terminal domain-containing protein n=1 Tax=Wolfiporia cocos (strain MD-104) TaxID=742152 RepID=A0A2H3J6B7_WOLCO|nr:hypothetical protein WOLCODRAFT_148353 [Wolfiporia cocos MD-104 SS10]